MLNSNSSSEPPLDHESKTATPPVESGQYVYPRRDDLEVNFTLTPGEIRWALQLRRVRGRPLMKPATTQKTNRRRWAWFFGSLAASAVVGSLPAKSATVADCAGGEYVEMIDPVVSIIEGPGDVVDEQARWSLLNYSYLEGPLKIALGETGFDLERVP